jgi:hypothetical protein
MKQGKHHAETVALIQHFMNPSPQISRKTGKDAGEKIDIHQEKS